MASSRQTAAVSIIGGLPAKGLKTMPGCSAMEADSVTIQLECDLSALERLLAHDLIYIHSTGVSRFIYGDLTTTDREIRLLSATAALFHGSISMKLKVKGERKTCVAFSSTRGEWF